MEEDKKPVLHNEIIKNSEGYLSAIMKYAILKGILSNSDTNRIREQLWLLLMRQTNRFTMGDSSSVPVETAQELLTSIHYCIGIHLKKYSIEESATKLKNKNLSDIFDSGQECVATLTDKGKDLLQEALKTALSIDNLSYRDTLREIGSFFKNYDYRLFAHDIPCMIDYQLCQDISELSGIEYINEYLQRFIIENRFCGHFESKNIISMLRKYCPDYKEQLINIFEPVATNAIGLALLDRNIFSLGISNADRVELQNFFQLRSEEESLENLIRSSEKLNAMLNIKDLRSAEYLKNTVIILSKRIKALKNTNGFENLFIGLREKESSIPAFQYHDGSMMDDESLRMLIEEMQDCRYLSDKVIMIRDRIHSVRDLVEVLNICFCNDEFDKLFSSFNDIEIAVIMNYLFQKKNAEGEWNPESEWEALFINYIKVLSTIRKKNIAHILGRDSGMLEME